MNYQRDIKMLLKILKNDTILIINISNFLLNFKVSLQNTAVRVELSAKKYYT